MQAPWCPGLIKCVPKSQSGKQSWACSFRADLGFAPGQCASRRVKGCRSRVPALALPLMTWPVTLSKSWFFPLQNGIIRVSTSEACYWAKAVNLHKVFKNHDWHKAKAQKNSSCYFINIIIPSLDPDWPVSPPACLLPKVLSCPSNFLSPSFWHTDKLRSPVLQEFARKCYNYLNMQIIHFLFYKLDPIHKPGFHKIVYIL